MFQIFFEEVQSCTVLLILITSQVTVDVDGKLVTQRFKMTYDVPGQVSINSIQSLCN